MRLIKIKRCNRNEAEALAAEVFGSDAKAELVINQGEASYQVVTHLSISACYAALHAADLIVSSTRRLGLDIPAGSGHYFVIYIDGFDTHIVGTAEIERAALRMAA